MNVIVAGMGQLLQCMIALFLLKNIPVVVTVGMAISIEVRFCTAGQDRLAREAVTVKVAAPCQSNAIRTVVATYQ